MVKQVQIINEGIGTPDTFVDMTAEEETVFDALQVEALAKQAEIRVEMEQAEADKITGNQKMLDLGLSQPEIDAITNK